MARIASLSSQLLHHFPRTEFSALVKKYGVEIRSKGFSCWTQFVAMRSCHLARANSLREICQVLSCCMGKLSHLGVSTAPKRSTLSYTNQHRPSSLFRVLFFKAWRASVPQGSLDRKKDKFNFKNKLLSLDSFTITMCLSLFPIGRVQNGLRAGSRLTSFWTMTTPCPALSSSPRGHGADVTVAQGLPLNPGSILVLNRGYQDYALFGKGIS
ncbi:hypothetical protein DFAR_1260026 [Desulfarculales bacterium]